jgi:peptidoglycan/LPS O-acetylase OafA/YrhL
MLSKSNRILQIDAWRCIAVTMVIISHLLKFSNPWYREHLPWIIMGRAQMIGQFGVKIFFCISGYVICRGLLSEIKMNGRISMRAFYVRRFLRILPPLCLYIFGLVLLALCGIVDIQQSQLVYAGLFLCNFDLGKCGWLLGHTWSLAYEEQFYLVFPIIFVVAATSGRRWAVSAVTTVMMIASLAAIYSNREDISFATSTFTFMLTGCIAAMYWEEIAPVLARLSVAAWLMLSFTAFMMGSIVIWPSATGAVLNAVFLPALVCVMVLATPVKSRRIADFFLNSTVVYLGKISFTIYLWQQLATSAATIKSPWINFIALGGTVVIGILSYRYLERPLMRAGSAFSKRVVENASTRSTGFRNIIP